MAHDRLLAAGENDLQPEPAAFVVGLNQGLRGRFGNSRYVTMFYGEIDLQSKTCATSMPDTVLRSLSRRGVRWLHFQRATCR
jgi:serine phosphatase RsbU (regulator of sigma subunit)